MGTPQVSVLMSVYNGRRYLREAVESILGQSFGDFELIVIDDASTDATASILAEFAVRDKRVIVVRNSENVGLTRSLNRGLAMARGRYVARQDADDVSLPERLAVQAAYLDADPEAALAYGHFETMDSAGRILERIGVKADPVLVRWHLMFFNCLGCHSLVTFRRDPVLALGGYDPSCRWSQDHDLWLRLADVGDVAIIPQVLARYRVHEQSISLACREEQEAVSLEISRKRLSRLAGRDLPKGRVADLRRFWIGTLADFQAARAMVRDLQDICCRFLDEEHRRGQPVAETAGKLTAIIMERLIAVHDLGQKSPHGRSRSLAARWTAWKERHRRLAGVFPINLLLRVRRRLRRTVFGQREIPT